MSNNPRNLIYISESDSNSEEDEELIRERTAIDATHHSITHRIDTNDSNSECREETNTNVLPISRRIEISDSEEESISSSISPILLESYDEDDYENLNEISTNELISFYSPLRIERGRPAIRRALNYSDTESEDSNFAMIYPESSPLSPIQIQRPILTRDVAQQRRGYRAKCIGRVVNTEELCSICLGQLLDASDLFSFTSCTHSIHERCYIEHNKNKNITQCFICKSK